MYLAEVVITDWLIMDSAWLIKDILIWVYIFSRYVPILLFFFFYKT